MAIRVRGLRRKLNVGNKNYAYTLYPDNYWYLNLSITNYVYTSNR